MNNDWSSKEASDSARQLYETPEALGLAEACFQMMEAWVGLDEMLRWPTSFGLVRRALEAHDKDQYWERYWDATDRKQKEREKAESPTCQCGSTDVVALTGHESYSCSACLHKPHV